MNHDQVGPWGYDKRKNKTNIKSTSQLKKIKIDNKLYILLFLPKQKIVETKTNYKIKSN